MQFVNGLLPEVSHRCAESGGVDVITAGALNAVQTHFRLCSIQDSGTGVKNPILSKFWV